MITMENKMKEFVKQKNKREDLLALIKLQEQPFKERIKAIHDEMKEANASELELLEKVVAEIAVTNKAILDEWADEEINTVKLDNGIKITRSAIKSLSVHNTPGLLMKNIELIDDPEKLPFTVKWTNRLMFPMIESGIVDEKLASIEINHRLAVKKPKSE